MTVPSADLARLLLISDFLIDQQIISEIRQLWGEDTSEKDLDYSADWKCCAWPCRVPYEGGPVRDIAFQIYLCATFLTQRRKIVDRIHQLGCNLELCIDICGALKSFSLASATMKQLADLHVQLSFHPRAFAD